MAIHRTLALAAVSLLGAGLAAQSLAPQGPALQFRAGIDVVQLDVTVLDKNHRPITGLTQADFTILENGKPQPIAAFAEVDLPVPDAPPAPWMRDVAEDVVTNDLTSRRVIVIVLDDAHIPFDPGVVRTAKRIGHDVVNNLGPNDLAAVTYTFSGKKQDITSDRARLNASIDALVAHPDLGLPPSNAIYSAATARGAIPQGRGGPPPCSYVGKYRGMAACVSAIMASSVAQRTREIGLRMALGASSTQVVRLILGQGVVLAAVGIALGVGLAALSTRALADWLYGVTPLDRLTFAAAAALMFGVAVAATYLPARRAARIDPLSALKTE